MKITAIRAQVKNPNRVSIYIDEKYALSLNYNQLLDQKLHAGLEITEAQLHELKRTSDFGKAYERAMMYALLRPRSVREMQDYCRRKKWEPEDCQVIIDKLIAKRYVNDQVFAKSWVENRALNKSTSRRKLMLELKQKGIADDIIQEVILGSTYNESTALSELVAKKRRLTRYKGDDQKLMQYLARQGFGFDDIKQALAQAQD
ncbi:MAG TPA: RecX family transcriptional regulator [Candidatus Saccharimonadales bacterium]|nr:RecX family transcriptional regulator [Candidatus Saccharimonadales bacterium]